ncbi:hypothetical protein CO230_05150 [Chryseobacterium sp. 6424]|uniref:hypothetical protein n=1 Tax=Chryseobacterium sp. 6424 TaxID=2039166 RepID=UPI000EFCDF7D|nr:hypothetical protein [Chryseobacterium sp. 6424]AYO57561.1 hypothetical protein CO230_05150 [Chryseobacterium sp. 6424]
MAPENNRSEQDQRLRDMDYSPENDIFNQEEHVPIDGDGNPILDETPPVTDVGDILDVPLPEDEEGVVMDGVGPEDEENDFYSLSDNADDHESDNDDILG